VAKLHENLALNVYNILVNLENFSIVILWGV
jgi:hypothetical protein